MPKLKPSTAKAHTSNLVKACLENDLNQAKTAKKLGVTRQAVQDRFQKPEAQEMLQDIINKNLAQAGISRKKVYRRLNSQLDAKAHKQPDNNSRLKAIDRSLELFGDIKRNGNNDGKHGGNVIIQIIRPAAEDSDTDSDIHISRA